MALCKKKNYCQLYKLILQLVLMKITFCKNLQTQGVRHQISLSLTIVTQLQIILIGTY